MHKYLRQCVNAVRKEFRDIVPAPVHVRTRKCGSDAETNYYHDRFRRIETIVITIDKDLPLCSQVDSLVHEFAHVLDRSRHDSIERDDVHDEGWGICYSRVYRIVEGVKRDNEISEREWKRGH